jgi:hypothetical protein
MAGKFPAQSPQCARLHESAAEANAGKRALCDALGPFEYTVENAFIRSGQAVSPTIDYPYLFTWGGGG